MADPVTIMLISSVVSTVAGIGAQVSAQSAADAASENQQNILDRKEESQRQALTENSKRLQNNKQRQLAQLKVEQAAGGFNTGGGSALAVFTDIESRIDEEIDESTNQGLDMLGQINNQRANLKFGDKVRKTAGRVQMATTLIGGATDFASGYSDNYDRTRKDPFNIYK